MFTVSILVHLLLARSAQGLLMADILGMLNK
jgi:hypothetical protein